MKKIFLSFLILMSVSKLALADVAKVCDTTVSFEGKTQRHIMKVESNADNRLSGRIEIVGGGTLFYEKVEMNSYTVRSGLTPEMIESDELDSLNEGEGFIVHALALEVYMPSGVNLKDVRSLTLYKFVEENANIGITAFAEVRDRSGKVIGSFMGGLLVSPCK